MVLIFGNTSNKGESYEYFMKAEYELLQNDFKMAEKYYKKALSLSPDSPTILHSLVDLKIYQGKYSDAINYLERNLILDPDNKDFPEGMTMSQSVKNNILEINFKSNNVMETLLNTVDEVLSMIDMTSKTLEKVE